MAINHQRIAKLPANAERLAALCEDLGLDELTAWRHLRDQERARRLYSYQNERERVFSKW